MKNISELATQAATRSQMDARRAMVATGDKSAIQGNTGALMKRAIKSAFDRLAEIYPAARHELKTDALRANAEAGFLAAMFAGGVKSPEQMKRGLNRAATDAANGSRFLPSAGQFAEWCMEVMPEELGLPDYDDAFLEACQYRSAKFHNWSHLAVMWAAYTIPAMDYALQKEWKIRKRFDNAYRVQVDRVASGEELPVAGLADKRGDKPKCKPEDAGVNISDLFSLCS